MEKPIRILHVLQKMEAGGTQALLMNIYRNIDRNKIQFDFLVEYPEKQFYDNEVNELGGKIYYTSVRKDFNILRFERQLEQIIKDNNYKIIHVHAYTIGYFVLKTAKKCGVPVRIAHSHSNNMTVDIKQYAKKIMQKLYTLYATDYMACSDEAGKYLFKNKDFDVLNNAIKSEKFIYDINIRKKVRRELNLADAFVVGHVGRMKKEKNHLFLIEVFEKIIEIQPNAKLLMIGEGPLEKKIKEIISDKKLENRIIILKNRRDVNELLQAMDIFIFPSLYEGLGIAAIEAQASGIPVLMSDNIPQETIVTPLCKKLSLSETAEKWAKDSVLLASNELAHTNTQQYIINSNYDLDDVSKWIENYYLKKYKEQI